MTSKQKQAVTMDSLQRDVRKLKREMNEFVAGVDGLISLWDRMVIPGQNPEHIMLAARCSREELVLVKDIKEYWLRMAAIMTAMEFAADSAAHFSLGLPKKRFDRVAARERKKTVRPKDA